jgi:starch synthase
LKYGTVPIVRATGGLDDTIEPWDARTGKGTGFKFSDYTGEALLATIKQALVHHQDSSSWQTLMRNGMSRDFSWGASAREYGKIYDRARQMRASVVGPSAADLKAVDHKANDLKANGQKANDQKKVPVPS